METIGERLKRLREEAGISLQILAEHTSLSKGNLSSYENNKFKPSADALVGLARYFRVSIDWILTGREREADDRSERQAGAERLPELSDELRNILAMYQQLTERHQGKVERYIEELLERQPIATKPASRDSAVSSTSWNGEEAAGSETA